MDTSRLKRHVGALNNTGSRVVVVYRELPDDASHCLVVETDRVPDMYHDNIMEFANSKEAQETNDFYSVLHRRTFSDGLNALQALHYKGFLRKLPISLITLHPFPGKELPLELLNSQINGTLDEYQEKEKVKQDKAEEVERKNNPLASGDDEAIAKGLLLQAELMEEEAKQKRSQAFELAPQLKPKTTKAKTTSKASDDGTKKRGRPPLSAEQKAERAEQRKQKRRERDRAKAKEKRQAKKEAKLQEDVDAKILRDAARLNEEA